VHSPVGTRRQTNSKVKTATKLNTVVTAGDSNAYLCSLLWNIVAGKWKLSPRLVEVCQLLRAFNTIHFWARKVSDWLQVVFSHYTAKLRPMAWRFLCVVQSFSCTKPSRLQAHSYEVNSKILSSDTLSSSLLKILLSAGFYPGTPKLRKSPQEFHDCLDFYVAGKINRYCIAARLVNPIYNRSS